MQKLSIDSSRESILNSSLMGLEFEFYSNIDLEATQKSLAKLLDRKIRLEIKAHSDFVPSAEEFKMEPDMSGGKGLIELVTGPIPYRNARLVVIKMLKWISENGYTNDRASIHINLSFDDKYLEDPAMVSKMNILKFILEFDEAQVYKFFPDREHSAYAKSVKWIMPKWESFHFDANQIASNQYKFADTKYYGINFSKSEKNYLEFRYIGGKDYEKRVDDILYLTEMFLQRMWKSCNDPRFTPENKIELQRILNKNKPISDMLKDYTKVTENWPGIKILADLQDNNWLITDASLIFYVDQNASSNIAPEQLFVYNYDENSQLLDMLTEGILSLGGALERDEDGNPYRYVFKITDYISELLKSGEPLDLVTLGLKVYGLTDAPTSFTDTIIKNFSWNPKGVVLYGNDISAGDKRAIFEISYAEINN
jgi:hypothetical protein